MLDKIKLQQTLNKCIEMWWKPRDEINIKVDLLNKFWLFQIYWWSYDSYHELFSKDSGLMEFVDWNNPVEFLPKSRYIAMCWMTAQEKINYFNENSLLPIY